MLRAAPSGACIFFQPTQGLRPGLPLFRAVGAWPYWSPTLLRPWFPTKPDNFEGISSHASALLDWL